MDLHELAKNILSAVGGESNVTQVVHCATRLRFELADDSVADIAALEKMEGVITTVRSGGQFQVVIGNKVAGVYKNLESMLTINNPQKKLSADNKKPPLISRLIDIISSIFTPLLGAMAASGIIKGLLSIAFANNWLSKEESSAVILQSASDSLFYFLPVLLAITSARKFKTDVFVSVTMAGALIYPDIVNFYTQHTAVSFFGIPVMMMKYTGTVLPVILAVYVMSLIESIIAKYIHETIRNVILPFILLLIMVPLTLMTIGPIGIYTSEAVAGVFIKIFAFNPVIASALFCAGWQIFVIFGMHWAFTPVIINDISVLGRSTLKASTVPAVFAQSGAVLAVLLKTKDKKLKTLASGAFISSVFGITEPAVYGITLKLKRPFICAIIASAVGGGIVGYSNSAAISMGIPSLVTLPIFYGEGFAGLLIAIATSFIIAAVLTYLVGFEENPAETNSSDQPVKAQPVPPAAKPLAGTMDEEIVSPISGIPVPLAKVNDKVFSSGIVGDGIAIIPQSGKILSPVNGKVASVLQSGHAIYLLSDNGAGILIHIGIDTIQLGGKFFRIHVSEDDIVRKGDLLAECELEEIKNSGFDTITPVIITNSENYHVVTTLKNTDVVMGDPLLFLSAR
ncbi:PTS beta-glucoside transporter subunit IIABC [Tatumella morbirosei]|uniref:PTS system glucose-specific EIIA component n=1 Tax=Tatumella morbirosei TaxID=642227 RepID=A0A095VBS9_9GAMM|nr:beta-glucoside-specific PTS transporter subunit IIABC [Tatumella morbirosei]KGD72115.1 PTS beta-glucoside transporter subunit IIABC [Tatumella morbirosei]